MKEACYCGRTDEVEGRYLGDGEHAFRCHGCSRLHAGGQENPGSRRSPPLWAPQLSPDGGQDL